MPHNVFIRHTFIYICSDKKCSYEWKINEAHDDERLHCPKCGKRDYIEYVLDDQRQRYINRHSTL